jgi:hypothetical protein
MPIVPERNFITIGEDKVICDQYQFCKGALADGTVCNSPGTPGSFDQTATPEFTTGKNTGPNRKCRILQNIAGQAC